MNLDTALAMRFTELGSVPPQDIYDMIKFQLNKGMIMVVWRVTDKNWEVEVVEQTYLWRSIADKHV